MQVQFLNGTEVFCKTNMSMEGIILSTFQKLNGEVWCIFEKNTIIYMCPQTSLRAHKRVVLSVSRGVDYVERIKVVSD